MTVGRLPSPRRTIAVSATLATVLVGACSGADAPSSDPIDRPAGSSSIATSLPEGAVTTAAAPDGGAATTAPEASPIPPDDGDPEALARRALLTVEDFAEGWTASPGPGDPRAGEMSALVADCLGLAADAPSRSLDDRSVASPSFEQSSAGLVIDQDVVLADGITDAARAMEELTDPAAADCTASTFDAYASEVLLDPATNELPPGAEIAPMVVEVLADPADPTDRAAIRTSVTVRLGGAEVVVVVETWYLRQGRALSRIRFQSFDDSFPADVVADVVGLASERLALVG